MTRFISLFSPDCVLWTSLVVAVVFVIFRLARVKQLVDKVRGAGRFDIKASWLSNTGIFAAILTAVLKDKALLGEGKPLGTLVVVSVIFALLAVTAIVVYMGAERKAENNKEYECPVALYCVSTGAAIWAAFGQLATLGYLFWISSPEKITHETAIPAIAAIIVSVYFLGSYAWKNMQQQLERSAEARTLDSVPAREQWSLL